MHREECSLPFRLVVTKDNRMAFSANLTWQNFLELSATLAALAHVRSRFIPLSAAGLPRGEHSPVSIDAALPERAVALARAGLYNFLSATFDEPPLAAFVENLRQSGALAALADRGLAGDDLRQWGEGLNPREGAGELAAAYTQLLTRPGPRCVPLVASFYLYSEYDPAQMLSWGPAAEAAEAAYREAGLVVGCNGPCPPDHLAVEMQFMQHCAAREAAAWGESYAGVTDIWRRRQQAFLTTHLLPWASAFSQRVHDAGAHPYYLAMARLTADFLTADAGHLAEILTEAQSASLLTC